MRKLIAVVSVAALTALGGCSTWNNMSKPEKGAVVGAGTGALIGNAVSGGVLGTVGGAAVGGVIGHEVAK